MRLSVFCFAVLLTSVQVFAYHVGKAQNIKSTRVSFDSNNQSVRQLFDKLQQQTGVSIFYPSEKIDQFNNISFSKDNRTIAETLDIILTNTGLRYRQQNGAVVVYEPLELKASGPETIIGTVLDEKDKPLPGVTIKVKGALITSTTNLSGRFNIVVSDKETAVLQFSYVGYLTQELVLKDAAGTIGVKLIPDISKLDEVQIIAYGTTTKRLTTGNSVTVNAQTIGNYPTNNVLDVLQSSVPGMNISKANGKPGSAYTVRINGQNSISNGAATAFPLYVVDGVPYQGGKYNLQNSSLGGGDALNFINPQDIESITVLKDADATAIYGSRGANGVILITTKKGKAGPAKVEANVYSGITKVTKQYQLLNLQQYLQMRHEAKANDKSAVTATDYDINGTWDTTRSTNWSKYMMGGTGHLTNVEATISGGNSNVTYLVSGNYNRQTDLTALKGSDQTASIHFSINGTTSNNKFNIVFTGGYLYNKNTIVQNDLLGNLTLAPDAPAIYNPDGTLNFQNNTFGNPYVIKNDINNSPSYNLTSNAILTYHIIKNLDFKVALGFNKQDVNEFLGYPSTAYPPSQKQSASSSFTTNSNTEWSIEPQANYTAKLGKGELTATVGSSWQKSTQETTQERVTGFSSDLLIQSISSGTSITFPTPYQYNVTKFNAGFGRLNYVWDNKYILNGTGRYDGTSNFGENRRFHLFAAGGAAWVFSEESFFKDNLQFLSFGKLRVSYGTTGNSQIPPYLSSLTYSGSTNVLPYQGINGISQNRLPNADLSWETTKKLDVGIDLQILKGRISLGADFYRNRTNGVLGSYPLSIVTGFGGIITNQQEEIQNKGIEATLNSVNIKSDWFTWSSTLIFTRERNKLLSYPNLATSSVASQFIIGRPVNLQILYKSAGVNPQTGLYQFVNAQGVVTSANLSTVDKTSLVDINPDFYGAFQNNFHYKQFTLDFTLRFIKQNGKNAFGQQGAIPPGLFQNINEPTIVLGRWQKPGDIASIQRYGTDFGLLTTQGYANVSDAAYGDASYIRMQNVALGYYLPKSVLNKLHVDNIRLYVNCDNVFTLSRYGGVDPETQNILTLPPIRTITAGLQVTF